MIKPTVGRKVWFIPSDYAVSIDGYKMLMDDSGNTQPLDATIIGVHTDSIVNLHIIDTEGNAYFGDSITLFNGSPSLEADESYAMWMPYQVTQAAKDQGGVVQSPVGIVT